MITGFALRFPDAWWVQWLTAIGMSEPVRSNLHRIAAVGLIAVLGYPLVFLLLGGQWFLLLMFALTTTAAGTTLKMFLCTQCMNFACPLNEVKEETRHAFFECNPEHAVAWQVQVDTGNGSHSGIQTRIKTYVGGFVRDTPADKSQSHAKR